MDGQTDRQTDRQTEQTVLTVRATLGSVEHIEVNIPEHVLLVERVCLSLREHVEELLRVLHALLQDLVGLQGALQVHLLLREQSGRKLKVQVLAVRGGHRLLLVLLQDPVGGGCILLQRGGGQGGEDGGGG